VVNHPRTSVPARLGPLVQSQGAVGLLWGARVGGPLLPPVLPLAQQRRREGHRLLTAIENILMMSLVHLISIFSIFSIFMLDFIHTSPREMVT